MRNVFLCHGRNHIKMSAPARLLVTGSSGFVGSAVCSAGQSIGIGMTSIRRLDATQGYWPPNLDIVQSSSGPIQAVIHLAARAHILQETARDPLTVFRAANKAPSLALAEAAHAAGIRRFVFVSSIGVLGNRSSGRSLRPLDPLAPIEPYAVSKAEAEGELRSISERTGLEIVIIRPPLVHGPCVKGNFERLLLAVSSGRPLPLGVVFNRRSFLGVANLAEALLVAATAPLSQRLGTQTSIYHVADDGVISTRRLVEVLAEGMGVKPRLISVPRWLAVGGATLLGKGAMARRLFDDLEVDDSDFRRDFGWKPTIGLEDGLRLMAEDYARRMRDGSGYSA